jgi:hypothetical protein
MAAAAGAAAQVTWVVSVEVVGLGFDGEGSNPAEMASWVRQARKGAWSKILTTCGAEADRELAVPPKVSSSGTEPCLWAGMPSGRQFAAGRRAQARVAPSPKLARALSGYPNGLLGELISMAEQERQDAASSRDQSPDPLPVMPSDQAERPEGLAFDVEPGADLTGVPVGNQSPRNPGADHIEDTVREKGEGVGLAVPGDQAMPEND